MLEHVIFVRTRVRLHGIPGHFLESWCLPPTDHSALAPSIFPWRSALRRLLAKDRIQAEFQLTSPGSKPTVQIRMPRLLHGKPSPQDRRVPTAADTVRVRHRHSP